MVVKYLFFECPGNPSPFRGIMNIMKNEGKNDVSLEFRAVTKRFGVVSAVRDLRLSIRAGEIYGLIGPNGSGKTTTVKMAAGLYHPTAGSVRVRGTDMTLSPSKAKQFIGYIPDDPAAYDRLSGREFLEFVGEIRSMDRRERDRRIEALLGEFGIADMANGAFGTYSRGSKQKISIIAALLHSPQVLLVDEPMVGLDPESARVTLRLFSEFAHQGGAILLSTHSLPMAEKICNRFGMLKNGKLIAEGTPKELSVLVGHAGTLEDSYLALAGGA